MALHSRSGVILISAEEAGKLRDRMNADEDKSTETLSSISRSLAIGLALITYTFFFQKDHSAFVVENFDELRYASLFGVCAVVSDALQYFFAWRQVRLMRSLIKDQIRQHKVLAIGALEKFTKNYFYYLRDIMFWLKLVFVAIGSISVLKVIWSASVSG